ncbi:MAG: DUF1294 domain-containing protein [Faecalibacterium sp.]|nr:DUF1294 domain-containing protein [Ruminococcus sp.]MCM1391503.1 DUF1294 domain-containing protein [Ruminococcus sp.]MCM1485867.1 DUF1294 domain-containing protein [Faecalibacterium sp.]
MDKLPLFLCVYFAVVSLVAIAVTISDKRRAIKNRRRIPEKALIIIGMLGGALFEYITMKIIRHKTLHKKFMLGLPAIITAQIVLIGLIWWYIR